MNHKPIVVVCSLVHQLSYHRSAINPVNSHFLLNKAPFPQRFPFTGAPSLVDFSSGTNRRYQNIPAQRSGHGKISAAVSGLVVFICICIGGAVACLCVPHTPLSGTIYKISGTIFKTPGTIIYIYNFKNYI